MSDPRQGGNYTRPTPYEKPARYEVFVGHQLVGVYDNHVDAEQALRAAFFGPPRPERVVALVRLEDAQARKGTGSSSG